MQTHFTADRLAVSATLRDADAILRKCVHCGFCTATCPTFVLRGDELDSPRGRIYLIKSMLERDAPATETEVTHLDRCLTCLSCMTTCPSGVDYGHLVEIGREHVERTYRRPLPDRWMRRALVWLLPHGGRFRAVMRLAGAVRPLGLAVSRLLPLAVRRRAEAALRAVPPVLPPGTSGNRPGVFPADPGAGDRPRLRVGLHVGCVQPALAPQINDAIIRLLTRLGCEVVVTAGVGCCGAVAQHTGDSGGGLSAARANVAAWEAERQARGLEAIVVSASGCGSMVKDYGHLLKDDPQLAASAAGVAALACDVTELVARLHALMPLPPPVTDLSGLRVAYHAACSLQHGQKLRDQPKAVLALAGITPLEPRDPHLCCGSAGTYSLLQPDLSQQLQGRKVATLEALTPQVITGGNIGCLTHIGAATPVPVVHTAQLLDWAWGGPPPLS